MPPETGSRIEPIMSGFRDVWFRHELVVHSADNMQRESKVIRVRDGQVYPHQILFAAD